MHPKIVFPGNLAPLFADLSRPLHADVQRDPRRTPMEGREVSLAHGYAMEPGNFAGETYLDGVLGDFERFMSAAMGCGSAANGYPIHLRRSAVPGRPDDAAEAHAINILAQGCEVIAEDLEGLRRAMFRMQDEMRLRRAPILPIGHEARWTRLKTRIARSPVAPYRWLSGWELEDEHDYYPEEYLHRLAHSGVNGIWVAGLLRNMVASAVYPELGPPEHRLEKLNRLIEKAARHGIRVYLFCMEPRALPPEHPAAIAHPEIVGARGCLCTSVPGVREYIRQAMRSLFTEAPRLGGLINIFCGERPSNCWWHNEQIVQECPRCRQRPRAEVLAEVLDTFAQGIHSTSPSAEFMAWTYMMASSRETLPIAPMLEVATRCDRRVIWLGNFEHGCTKEICGKSVQAHEYSLSCVGPSDYFSDMAQAVRDSGRRIYAKLQVGTTYEMSSVPHIPVPGIVYDKIAAAGHLGVSGAMLGWIPGGFPSMQLKMTGEAAFEPRATKKDLMRRVAALDWGEAAAETVAAAWDDFARAWQLYPMDNAVLYWGPITRGPAYQLHLEREPRLAKPYNWGFTRKREPQPFEDQYTRWLGDYTVEQITGSFREMARLWQIGIDRLESIPMQEGPSREPARQIAVAKAVRLQCLSAANVYEFYALRDQLKISAETAHPAILERLEDVAKDELAVCGQVRALLSIDPTLGFESEIYDFSYSISLIDQKMLQVSQMLPIVARWRRGGVEREILERTVEEAETLRPDRVPDLWGD
jgi:hypothetical protein